MKNKVNNLYVECGFQGWASDRLNICINLECDKKFFKELNDEIGEGDYEVNISKLMIKLGKRIIKQSKNKRNDK